MKREEKETHNILLLGSQKLSHFLFLNLYHTSMYDTIIHAQGSFIKRVIFIIHLIVIIKI